MIAMLVLTSHNETPWLLMIALSLKASLKDRTDCILESVRDRDWEDCVFRTTTRLTDCLWSSQPEAKPTVLRVLKPGVIVENQEGRYSLQLIMHVSSVEVDHASFYCQWLTWKTIWLFKKLLHYSPSLIMVRVFWVRFTFNSVHLSQPNHKTAYEFYPCVHKIWSQQFHRLLTVCITCKSWNHR